MSIFGAVLLASFVITSCSPENNSKENNDSNENNEKNTVVASPKTDAEKYAKECMCEAKTLEAAGEELDGEKMQALQKECKAKQTELEAKYGDEESAEFKEFMTAMQAAFQDCL